MTAARRILHPAEAHAYLFRGDARFTLVSRATGARHQYRIFRKNNAWLSTVMTDDGAWAFVGVIRWEVVASTQSCKLRLDDPKTKAVGWFLRKLKFEKALPDSCELWAEDDECNKLC